MFVIFVQRALENLKNNESDKYIRNLREALHACPEFSKVIGKLLEDFDKNKTQVSNTEFTQLGEQVKEQIRVLISQGQYVAAYQILMRLMQMIPDDMELLKLKQQIISSEMR